MIPLLHSPGDRDGGEGPNTTTGLHTHGRDAPLAVSIFRLHIHFLQGV
jgi:hypothetical protein